MLPLSSTGIWFSSLALAAAIDLPVGQRILAQVVRRERELPAPRQRVIEHGASAALSSSRGLNSRKNGRG